MTTISTFFDLSKKGLIAKLSLTFYVSLGTLKKVHCFILQNSVNLAFMKFSDFLPSLVLSRNNNPLNMVRSNGRSQVLLKKHIVQNVSSHPPPFFSNLDCSTDKD